MSDTTDTKPTGGFRFLKGIRVRAIIDGNWFAVTDIAREMGTQTGAITQKVSKDDLRKIYTDTHKGYRDLVFLREAALYRMILRSNSRSPWVEGAQEEIIEFLVGSDVMGLRAALNAKQQARKGK